MLSRYAYNTLLAMDKFRDRLPQERQEFGALLEEGRVLSRMALPAALDVADSVAHMMAMEVVMRHSAWLQVLGIPPDTL